MASTRFGNDAGLTARMTLVMFLLGALFVAFVGGIAAFFAQSGSYAGAGLVAFGGMGVAFYQWWSSDKVAMRAMRAREVTPQEAPELHGMIDRLCALADMDKPRVGVADMAVPNAFATGRSPKRSVVCVTTGLLDVLDAEELEGVLAHELSHVAHRDVLVMTAASCAGIAAGLLMQLSLRVRPRGNSKQQTSTLAMMAISLVVSLIVYAVSFLLLRVLSRYRELCADRSGAQLTMKPAALASALSKISGASAATPESDLRANPAMSALCIAPAFNSSLLKGLLATHPPLDVRLEQLARIQTELGRDLR